MILPQLGEAAQKRLAASRVLIVGCGAIGSASAEQLARAGFGFIRIADRDIVEFTNLQRQVLFDESDALESAPKAVAAARRLARVNSSIRIDPHVVDVDADNVERFADVDLIIDGTDNVETRYLLNDVSVKRGTPWIYGACVGTEGRIMAIQPPATACLRCVFPQPPDPTALPTCDTAGVLGPAAAVVGATQAAMAIRLLTGTVAAAPREMLSIDLWSYRFRSISLDEAKDANCPACGLRRFEFLENPDRDLTVRLCGRNAVQIRPLRAPHGLEFESVVAKLALVGKVRRTDHLIRASIDAGIELTIFADGRAIVHGTADAARARSIYARFIGA